LATQELKSASIELQDRLIMAADEKQRRGLHAGETDRACQIRAPATRYHSANARPELRGGNQRCGAARAGAEVTDAHVAELVLSIYPLRAVNQPLREQRDVEAMLAGMNIGRLLRFREKIEEQRCYAGVLQFFGDE